MAYERRDFFYCFFQSLFHDLFIRPPLLCFSITIIYHRRHLCVYSADVQCDVIHRSVGVTRPRGKQRRHLLCSQPLQRWTHWQRPEIDTGRYTRWSLGPTVHLRSPILTPTASSDIININVLV